ncbi:MAG TPA: non-canonical purine NTP pyrophosphatase [Aggregatilineales bacterium]|nr:non-canonical purine NTP pyrophosphatase [Aggregatilineales bacterium]
MKIFISYAHEDPTDIVGLQRALDIHEVWFDHRLSVGQEWWNEIERQISGCDCFMLLMSARSLASEYCQKELEIALKLGKPIAPVMLEPMEIPPNLARFQVISLVGGVTTDSTVKLLNGLFEIERQVFNPLKPPKGAATYATMMKLSVGDLYFATTNPTKKRMYEQILNVQLQTSPVNLDDIQHVDAGEVALDKAAQAYEILRKPVFVDHSALCIRAWGGLPGGLTTTFLAPAGLHNICKMLQPFADKYAESMSVIAFTDGYLRRKFVGVVPGEIPETPRGNGYSWNNIFVPDGFTTTYGEMTEDQQLSISSRRRAIVQFMQFLQTNYEFT